MESAAPSPGSDPTGTTTAVRLPQAAGADPVRRGGGALKERIAAVKAPARDQRIAELIAGRAWLFEGNSYYTDSTHLASIWASLRNCRTTRTLDGAGDGGIRPAAGADVSFSERASLRRNLSGPCGVFESACSVTTSRPRLPTSAANPDCRERRRHYSGRGADRSAAAAGALPGGSRGLTGVFPRRYPRPGAARRRSSCARWRAITRRCARWRSSAAI